MKYILFVFLLTPLLLYAQTNDNFMYSSGRIYVVIAVLLIILFGLILYLVRIEKKVKRLEKSERNN